MKTQTDGSLSTWANLSADFGDLPVNDLVQDSVKKDLYAATDFGVLRLPLNTLSWLPAATGLPNVEVAGLTKSYGDHTVDAKMRCALENPCAVSTPSIEASAHGL